MHDAFTVCFYNVTYIFRVNLHSVIVWILGNSFLKTGTISEISMTATGFKQGVSSISWFEIQAFKECRCTINLYVT